MMYFKNYEEAVEAYRGARFSEYLVVTRTSRPDGSIGFESNVYSDGTPGSDREGELVEVMGPEVARKARGLVPGGMFKVRAKKTDTTWFITRME